MKKYVSGVPNERVQIDNVGPLIETHRSNKFLIVLTDCFTKWVVNTQSLGLQQLPSQTQY